EAVTGWERLMANTSAQTATGTPEELDFSRGDARIAELLDHMREIADLGALQALAEWDQNTALPDGAGEVRGMQHATLQGVLHEKWTAQRVGALIAELEEPVQSAPFTDADRALLWHAQREYKHATKLPRGLVEEMARVESSSFEAWKRARVANDFASWAPWRSRTITLQREVADRLGYEETRYDALLDHYEPGMTTRRLNELFPVVRDVSVRLLRRIE